MRRPEGKIIADYDQLVSHINSIRDNQIIVSTNGCFDILHVGHVKYLINAKDHGNILIVAINGDQTVRALKGKDRPYYPISDRVFCIAGLECVDYVTVFDEPTPCEFLAKLKPDIHIKGGDYKIEDLPEAKVVQAGGGICIAGLNIANRSTTDLVKRIQNTI